MRAFVAVDLPDAVRDALEEVQSHLRVGRHADPETFHITLAFLDDQPAAVLEECHTLLERIRMPDFSLQVRGLDTFGARSPRLVWAGADNPAALRDLRDKVRSAARVSGIELPREKFRPHVTLARFGGRLEPEELEKLRAFLERFETFPAPPFEVSGFTLYRSILGPGGPVHDVLARYRLDGEPAEED